MSSAFLHTLVAGTAFVVGAGTALALYPSRPQANDHQTTAPSPSPSSSSGASAGTAVRAIGQGGVIQPANIGPVADFLQRAAYVTAYDRRNRIPAWTAEHLTPASLQKPPPSSTDGTSPNGGAGDRSNSTFREDEAIPPQFRAHLLDYFKSGYDRGHMVPAADAKSSQKAMDETFLLSNVAPQVGDGFNRHYWAYLEAFCRNLTQQFPDVYVFTVPLFLPQKSPDGKWRITYEVLATPTTAPVVSVPTHFAKVILTSRPMRSSNPLALVKGGEEEKKEWSVGAFVLPNQVIDDRTPLQSFLVPVEAVESSSGLSLLPESMKSQAKGLCQVTKCEIIVRKFDDSQKKLGSNGGGKRRERSASI